MSKSKEDQLLRAAIDGDLEKVTVLCGDPGVDVNCKVPHMGLTPLHCAVGQGHKAVAEYLLSLPRIDPNLADATQATPFFIACQQGQGDVVMTMLEDPRVDVGKPVSGAATPFYIACECGHRGVVSLLLDDPRVDPCEPNENGATPFFAACQNGHGELVSLLLEDPRVDPHRAMSNKGTPILMVCQNGLEDLVPVLLADPRVDPNFPSDDQSTPLWFATQNGHLPVVRHLLASGRDIDTRLRSLFNNKTAPEIGRIMGTKGRGPNEAEEAHWRKKTNGPLAADLIEEYERDPVAVRGRLRAQPGLREHFVAHLFALVVFHSDGLLNLRRVSRRSPQGAHRFFEISRRLPLEVQMVLCNRAFGSPKDTVLSKKSEPYFQCLSRPTTW